MNKLNLNKVVILEGPPGAGKTTLLQKLAGNKDITIYRQNLNAPLERLIIKSIDLLCQITEFNKAAQSTALTFKQNWFLNLDRKRLCAAGRTNSINIIESGFSFTLYYCKFISEYEDLNYESLLDRFIKMNANLPQPDINVWLDVSVDECVRRQFLREHKTNFPFSDADFIGGFKKFTLSFWRKYQPYATVKLLDGSIGIEKESEMVHEIIGSEAE